MLFLVHGPGRRRSRLEVPGSSCPTSIHRVLACFQICAFGSPETDKQALHVSQSSLLTVFFPLSMWRLYASPFSKVLLLCSPPFLSYAPAVLLRFQCRKADRPYSTQGPDDVRCPPEARPSHGLLKCSTAGRLCRPMSVASP